MSPRYEGKPRQRILTVCLKDNGAVVRVDVIPPLQGTPLPPTLEGPNTGEPVVYETGCGDPVSLTPPHAVLEVAASATRHAVGLLLETPVTQSGEIRDYR
jgi:hypothetical protein